MKTESDKFVGCARVAVGLVVVGILALINLFCLWPVLFITAAPTLAGS